ncbi:hypothetical protein HDV63DRAFT_101856 [Trichoderma sp. SZMC 28014]
MCQKGEGFCLRHAQQQALLAWLIVLALMEQLRGALYVDADPLRDRIGRFCRNTLFSGLFVLRLHRPLSLNGTYPQLPLTTKSTWIPSTLTPLRDESPDL